MDMDCELIDKRQGCKGLDFNETVVIIIVYITV